MLAQGLDTGILCKLRTLDEYGNGAIELPRRPEFSGTEQDNFDEMRVGFLTATCGSLPAVNLQQNMSNSHEFYFKCDANVVGTLVVTTQLVSSLPEVGAFVDGEIRQVEVTITPKRIIELQNIGVRGGQNEESVMMRDSGPDPLAMDILVDYLTTKITLEVSIIEGSNSVWRMLGELPGLGAHELSAKRVYVSGEREDVRDIPIGPGLTNIYIEVTAEDNITMTNYSLRVLRQLEFGCDTQLIACITNNETLLSECESAVCTITDGNVLLGPRPLLLSDVSATGSFGVQHTISELKVGENGADLEFEVDFTALGEALVQVLYLSDVRLSAAYSTQMHEYSTKRIDVLCDRGFHRPSPDEMNADPHTPCTPCVPGFHSEIVGASFCVPCAPNTYQRLPAQAECRNCQLNSFSLAGSWEDCVAEPGYWRVYPIDDATDDPVFVECPPDTCKANNTCHIGYDPATILCGRCDNTVPAPGIRGNAKCQEDSSYCFYRDTSERCLPCPPASEQMPMLIGFGAGVLVVGYIVGKVGLHALAYAKKDLKGGVSFVTFIQIVSLLGQFKFEWPEGLKAFFGWFSVFKLNVAVARPECTTAPMRNAVFKYYLQLLLPFVVGLALLLYFASAVFHAMLVKRASRWYRRAIPGMVRKAAAVKLRKEVTKLRVRVEVNASSKTEGGRLLAYNAPELLELWEVLQSQSFAEKYQPMTDSDQVALLYQELLRRLYYGRVPMDAVSELLHRMSPLHRKANFPSYRDQIKRERAIGHFQFVLLCFFSQNAREKTRHAMQQKVCRSNSKSPRSPLLPGLTHGANRWSRLCVRSRRRTLPSQTCSPRSSGGARRRLASSVC